MRNLFVSTISADVKWLKILYHLVLSNCGTLMWSNTPTRQTRLSTFTMSSCKPTPNNEPENAPTPAERIPESALSGWLGCCVPQFPFRQIIFITGVLISAQANATPTARQKYQVDGDIASTLVSHAASVLAQQIRQHYIKNRIQYRRSILIGLLWNIIVYNKLNMATNVLTYTYV